MSQLDLLYQHMNDDLEVKDLVKNERSEIARFYAGKTLFITGATGFMGLCIVEKLLRSCPDVKKIYLLMRKKHDYSVEERVKKYFQQVIFAPLKRLNPNFYKKVTVLNGDLSLEHMGLSETDRNTLINEVNIIIHNGANVKFDIRVNLSLKTNVLGTKYMLDLAEECKNLEMFLHVSSAYSHCYKKKIEEEFYPPPMDLENVYKTIKRDLELENGIPEEEVNKMIGDYPNIYIFTKAIAEDLVREYGLKSNFPIAIYRPSIVMSAYKEPLPGWCGNRNGPVYIFLGAGLGIFHSAWHFGHPLDFIPSDLVINLLIAIAWDSCDKWKTEKKTYIYNYGSSTANPITLIEMYDYLKTFVPTDMSLNSVWVPWMVFTSKLWLFWIIHAVFHFIPACILDIILIAIGKKPKAVSLFMWASKNLDKVDYFGNGNWKIYIPESQKLISRLNSVDRELFYCDINKFSWNDYLLICWRGLKYYLLKEPLDTKACIRKYNQLWYIHYGAITIITLLFGYFLISNLLNIFM